MASPYDAIFQPTPLPFTLTPPTQIDAELASERQFRQWYSGHASRLGLNPNPDDPRHFYDYRAAFRAGARPDAQGHWPSQFKREGHPRLVIGGVDTRTGQPPERPTPQSPSPYDAIFAPRPAPKPQRTYLTGGPLEKVFDVLRTGEYAVGGVLSGKGIRRGIAERTESGPQFATYFQRLGAPDSFATDAAAFMASLAIDPINLVGAGLVGKGLRAIGAVRAAEGLARVGPAITAPARVVAGRIGEAVVARPGRLGEIVRGARGVRALEPILDPMVRQEARGVEAVVRLGETIRQDALRLTGGQKASARRLDQALGMYFDAGADTMLSAVAKGTDISAARTAATKAQQEWLRLQPEETTQFISRWADRIRQVDTDFAGNLVRTGMMRPETAAKWEGLHLRRIYQKFEDPQAFAEFLERTDPAEAARLLGRLERGVPIQRVGQPIPTAVAKQRQLLEESVRGRLGEIREASSRLVAGGTLAQRAIARGDAFQKIAAEFVVDERLVRALPNGTDLFRQLPETAGWGALAGKWVPKEIADPLLRSRNPMGFLEKTTGWFKFAKVILNPATHFRNMRTNVSLVHNQMGLGGLNPATWARAIREVATNGPTLQEAKGVSSAFIDTFTNSELRQFITDGTEHGLAVGLRRMGNWAARTYQAEEQVGKMAVYLTATGRGLSPQTAASLAEQALFNYRKVPPIIDRMRRIGIYPFITFPYKVAAETLPQALRRPGRFSQQSKIIAATSEELTPEERKVLPEYLRDGYVKLPYNINGKPVLFQLSYELPYGDIAESGTPPTAALEAWRRWQRGDLRIDEALRTAIPVMPPVLQIAAEVLLNRAAFTGRNIVPEGETNRKAAELLSFHVARFVLPSIASKTLVPGGEFQRAVEAALPGGATGQLPSGREALPLREAALSTFVGLKTVPVDLQRERQGRLFELRRALKDNESRLYSVRFDRSLNPEQRQRRAKELVEKRKRMLVRFRETGRP